MPMTLQGSCRCEAVRFTVNSHAPYPYQLCYCSICRKTAGGGGYAINLSAVAATLDVKGRKAIGVYRARYATRMVAIARSARASAISARSARARCGCTTPRGPTSLHPFASIIDTRAAGAAGAHASDAALQAQLGESRRSARSDLTFDLYPKQSIEQWHKQHGLWIA